MKLEKINYNSAVIFGAFFLVMSLISGGFVLFAYVNQDVPIDAVKTFIVDPLSSGVIMYLFALVGIVVYNFVAKKYPISWTVKK